jgi:hypothetical protein
MSNVGNMEDIQNLFKETIAEFMENGLDSILNWIISWATASTTTRTRVPTTAETGTATKRFEPVLETWTSLSHMTERVNFSLLF